MKRVVVPLLIWTAFVRPAPAADALELRDGDRVVFLGGTFIEREQKYGYWETVLTLRHADKHLTFRNLGWSGDTVLGEARAGFGSPRDGLKRLVEQTLAQKPTVLVIGYGNNEAFAGAAGLPRFREGLKALLDTLAPAKARVTLLAPWPMEERGRPLPDPTVYNRDLALYREVIREAAHTGGHAFLDLHERLTRKPANPLTENGLHLTEYGYQFVSSAWCDDVRAGEDAAVKKLRAAIVEKNQLFFHRYRPQNETYLFGFRKHEQGTNAKEVAEFDALVAKAEAEINSRKGAKAQRREP